LAKSLQVVHDKATQVQVYTKDEPRLFPVFLKPGYRA
jgi:hypothetical protein